MARRKKKTKPPALPTPPATPRARIRKPLPPGAAWLAAMVLGILVASAWTLTHTSGFHFIRSDGQGYYAYLRAYIIHHEADFSKIPWNERHPTDFGFWRHPKTGRLANQYPIGTALAELPFFIVAHAVAIIGGYPKDGLSTPYQVGIYVAALCWFLAGLAAAWSFLAERFGSAVASVALTGITLGTNLLHYGVADPSFSHAYAFGAFSLLLWQSDRFWNSPSPMRAIWLGLLAALLVSIRNFDLVLLPLALYPALLLKNRPVVRAFAVPFLAAAFLTMLPQLITSTYYVGAPWASTYPSLFTWTEPRLFLVFFSVHKGWFFWTPVVLLGVIGLFAGLRSAWRPFCGFALAAIAIIGYVIASWASPDMGHSFGHRGFVDCLPAVALGIASLPPRFVKPLLVVLILFNLFLLNHYWQGRIMGNHMTWKAYKRVVVTPVAKFLGMTPPMDSLDSSQRRGLSAEFQVLELRREGDTLKAAVSVHNTGTALWLDSGPGVIQLAIRPWERADCSGKEVLDRREPLRREVAPSQTIIVRDEIRLSHVPRPFAYLCIEMVSEGVTWFRDVGSPPLVVKMDPTLLEGWRPPAGSHSNQ